MTLGHLWWFHVPLEFESTFFWSFILKTRTLVYLFFPFPVIRRKIFLTPCYIVTRCGSPWLDETPPGSVSRQKGDEDQNLSHGMLSSSAWQNKINSYWDCPGKTDMSVRRQGGWCVEFPWYLLVGGTIIWRKRLETWSLGHSFDSCWEYLREVYCYSYYAKRFCAQWSDAKIGGWKVFFPVCSCFLCKYYLLCDVILRRQ